jgi:molecular chaperone GrpE (heat shock protein)
MPDPEIRRAILARVEAALDAMETAEALPEGIDASIFDEPPSTPDLYELLAQMTALTREVQLQGRAANRLSAEVSQVVQQVSESTPAQINAQITARVSAARREAHAEVLGELLEIGERFARGRDEARKRLDSFESFFLRFGGRPIINALLRGNELALERLDETLRRYGVHEIACERAPFDPNTMRAVELDVRDDVAPGLVTEVVRRGYRSADRILRYAEVKVSAREKQS